MLLTMEHSKYRFEYEEGKEYDFRVYQGSEDITREVKNNVLIDLFFETLELKKKTIEEFKTRMSDLCEKCPTGKDRLSGRPLYAREGENVWRDLINDVAEELLNKSSEQFQPQAPIKM